MASTATPQKKVRVACQRCRARRIKCDGGVPSCANCAKAGAPCVDVDARNAEQLIPRNSLTQAKARIQWLEEIIGSRLPDIDLSAGPQVDFDGADLVTWPEDANQNRVAPTDATSSSQLPRVSKRSHAALTVEGDDTSFNTEARSVALDLGRLSLNADSREKHYLGSSSGLIFSYLIGTPPSTADEPAPAASRKSLEGSDPQKQKFGPLHRTLISALPAKDDALLLVQIYVQHVHPDHPILHMQSLLSALNSLYICSDLDMNAELDKSGWPLAMPAFAYNGEVDTIESQPTTSITLPAAMFHCFMVFTLAATVRLGGSQNEFAPAPFYRAAKTVALDALSDTSIPSLQGVYLLAVHALMTPIKLNVWTLTYVCIAHCIDLGIHRQQNDLPPAAKVTRSLLFHSIYSLDRTVATIQGRPLGIRDETFDIDIPAMAELVAEIDNQTLPILLRLSLMDTAPYIRYRFLLDGLISEIKTIFYFLPGQINPSIWSTDYEHHQQRLQQALESWYGEVCSVHTRSPSDGVEWNRWKLNLEQQYCAAMVLLFQPSQIFRNPDDHRFQQCFDAAARQINCYNALYEELDMLHFDFRTVRSIFACGATIIYCFWKSKALQKSPQVTQLPIILRLCTTLLAVGAIWWPSVKRGRASFQRLVDLTLQRMSDLEKVHVERSGKRRYQRMKSANGQNLPSQQIPTLAGEAPPALSADLSTYSETNLSNIPNSGPVLVDNVADEWHVNGTFDYDVTGDHQTNAVQHNHFEDESPSYELTTVPSHVEPEIAAFLNDYFLDDASWNFTDTGPPLSLHFGNL